MTNYTIEPVVVICERARKQKIYDVGIFQNFRPTTKVRAHPTPSTRQSTQRTHRDQTHPLLHHELVPNYSNRANPHSRPTQVQHTHFNLAQPFEPQQSAPTIAHRVPPAPRQSFQNPRLAQPSSTLRHVCILFAPESQTHRMSLKCDVENCVLVWYSQE